MKGREFGQAALCDCVSLVCCLNVTNLLADECWMETPGDESGLYMPYVSATRWVVYFQGLGAAVPDLTQISARRGRTGARSTGGFFGWNFPA